MSDASFADLGLNATLLESLEAMGFESPTPIQAEAIPVLLEGRDIVGGARTGSGKTAAFGLPMLQRIQIDKKVRGLVLAPTRELAQQVTGNLRAMSPKTRIFAIYGGSSYDTQITALRRGVSVVVGTPGRVLDLIERGELDLSHVQTLVLDEADQMLQMGFIDDVETIIDQTPAGRQVALFSATMPGPIRRIAQKHLADAVEVQIGGEGPSIDHITQQYMVVPHRFKVDALMRVLEGNPGISTLVFARTRKSCAEIADTLAKQGVGADALHGDLSQSARERVLSRLRSGGLQILIATDVAARGIDVEGLELVINLDLPDELESYVHRIGRTGRAGREGRAISFVAPRQRGFVRAVEREFGVEMESLEVPSDAEVARQQRAGLEAQLESVRDAVTEDSEAAVQRLLDTGDWTAWQVAVAALHLLAEQHGIGLGDLPDDVRPDWSRSRAPREQREGFRESKKRQGDRLPDAEAHLFIAAGTRHGIRAGDIVGALANEVGIPSSRIGRILLQDFKAFVGLTKADLRQALKHKTLVLRGRRARLDEARRPSRKP